MPDLVIFDCDGVLVDSEVLAVEAFCEVLVAAGVPAKPAMIARCFGMKQADILRSVERDTGVPVPAAVGDALWPATRALFDRSLAAHARRGATSSRGSATGRAAWRPRRAWSASASAWPRPGSTASSATTSSRRRWSSRGKPAPDLFLLAAERMGVAPGRCAVIEDSVFGVQGARAAGMRALGFLGGSHIVPDHGIALLAEGAEAALATFPAVERALFPA